MSDLQSKYQILAAEYAKLKAQIPVLKKAVLDERAVEDSLKESLKEKDQSIRKFEQEVDSLTFRNQQLSSRVGVLQKELEDVNLRNKKSKNKNSSVAEPSNSHAVNSSIIDEELKSKIEENVRLHRKVYESDQDHQAELSRLQKRLAVLESDATQHESVLTESITSHREKINKLQEDKAILEAKLHRQEKETKEATLKAKELEGQVASLEKELGTEIRQMSNVIQSKLTFNDTACEALNALNVPIVDRQHQQQARELISQANPLLRDFINAVADYCSHSGERASILSAGTDSEEMSRVNSLFCAELRDHAAVLSEVKQSFEVFHKSIDENSLILLETSVQLKVFGERWTCFTVKMQKLLPYQMQSLVEESSLSSCPSTLSAKNEQLRTSIEQFCSALLNVDKALHSLISWGMNREEHSRSSQKDLFEQFNKTFKDFHESTRELSRHYNAKLALEHQLPTVTQKLKAADECLLSAVISLVTSTSKSIFALISRPPGKDLLIKSKNALKLTIYKNLPTNSLNISAFLFGNLDVLTSSSCMLEAPLNPAVSDLHRKAVEYMDLIQRPQAESVPYSTAVQNRKMACSFNESKDTLTQQVVGLQKRVSELEAEREHWMLETQLLQLKYQKAVQGASTEKTQVLNNVPTIDKTQDTDHLNKKVVVDSVVNGNESEAREKLITSHYQSRLADATCKLQLSDSKALHFSSECRALQKRLQISDGDKQRICDDLSTANKSIAQLKDELQTTTRSYEAQLSMMSEHLAGMNERLTTQKDEIDVLKYELQQANATKSKTVKKGRTG